MILATHDLRRHVAGRSRGFFRIVRTDLAGDAEIGDPQVAVLLEDKVLWLYVTMDDAVLVDELESQDDASAEEFSQLTVCLLVCSSLNLRKQQM
jgi:hypothetical protein